MKTIYKIGLISIIGLSMLNAASAESEAGTFSITKFPQCQESGVLSRIVKLFNKAENMTWHRGIEMTSISRPHGHGKYGFAESAIPRRYCHAYAYLTNGKRHKVYYVIEEGMGFAGTNYNVDFCLIKYDPWRINDAYCRTVRPQ